MFASTDAAPQFEASKALRQSLKEASAVNRSGRIFLGTVLLVSAAGLWVIPVDMGDAAMRLIKLLFSACLLALGAMFILSARDRLRLPEIRLDPEAREIHIVKPSGTLSLCFDDLAEVSFCERTMTARSSDGRVQLVLPLTDEQTENALREAFSERG